MAICGFASLAGYLFLYTLYLQDVLGYSALKAGLYILPVAAMAMLCSPLSGRLVASRGPRAPLIGAGIAITVSALLLTDLDKQATSTAQLIGASVIFGIGFGLINAPITNTAVSGMPRSQAGVAAAVASTSRQIGQSLGIAVIVSVVVSSVHGTLQAGLAPASHIGWWIMAGCGVAVLLVGMLTTGAAARRSAARVADQLAPPDTRTPIPTP
jgi:MFS family permease